MEDYLRTPGCRREFILRYFGEATAVECTTCDRCSGGHAAKDEDVLTRRGDIAAPVLVALLNLRFPVGKVLLSQLVLGSREKRILEWGLDRNPAYGRVRAKKEQVTSVIEGLMREGYIEAEYVERGSVLRLTAMGARAARAVKLDAPPAVKARATASTAGAKATPESTDAIRSAVLRCLAGLKTPVGAGKVAEVLTGSKAEWVGRWGADRLDVYGSVSAGREAVLNVINSMLSEGLLRKGGADNRPVLLAAEAGPAVADTVPVETPAPPPPTSSPPSSVDGPGEMLDAMLRELLTAEPERAKELLPGLRLFHPAQVTARLESAYDRSSEPRAKKRAVWAAGELGGADALPFLIASASSDVADVRRIAASAIGKAVPQTKGDASMLASRARRALEQLAKDPAPQVCQYARKAIGSLARETRE